MLFAAVHLYWAVGGSWLLASSAGVALATSRPLVFVLFGLWGVALVLLAAAGLELALARRRLRGRPAHLASVASGLAGVVLLLRGIGVEVLLLADLAGVASSVGREQTRVSLALWNPWFVLGGVVFLLAGIQTRRERRSTPAPRPADVPGEQGTSERSP